MSSRTAPQLAVPLTLLIAIVTATGLVGSLRPPAARSQIAGKPNAPEAGRPPQSADEILIRELDAAYIRDYNRGDAKALASVFIEDAEVFEAEGARYRGRDLIEKSFAETFANEKGARIALEIESIRFLTPDAAKEEGRSIITPTKGGPVSRPYTVLYVKRDGRWQIASVREELDLLVRPHDRLEALEWMIGEWLDEGPEATVRFDCKWSEDGNFLIRTYSVKQDGKTVMSGTQRIGWDPLARQFRSWEFDSEGGYGDGKWSRDGESWVVKSTGVRPEGITASSTNILARERPDRVRWISTDRVLGDESVPGELAYVLIRVPPPPGQGPKILNPTLPANTSRIER
jgi:uncharacterized protein (TIGR02246 family)